MSRRICDDVSNPYLLIPFLCKRIQFLFGKRLYLRRLLKNSQFDFLIYFDFFIITVRIKPKKVDSSPLF